MFAVILIAIVREERGGQPLLGTTSTSARQIEIKSDSALYDTHSNEMKAFQSIN